MCLYVCLLWKETPLLHSTGQKELEAIIDLFISTHVLLSHSYRPN
jgi:hypothetical protein